MDRIVIRLDGQRDRMGFKLASAAEYDSYNRTFWDESATHYLHRELDRENLTMWFEMRPIPDAPPAGQPKAAQPHLTVDPGTNELRAKLEAMTTADLLTMGPEKGAKVDKGMKRPALVAAVLAAMTKSQAAGKP